MALFPREVLTDHIGAYRTQSLFLETNRSALEPIMTLKEIDWEYKGKVLPSLKAIYMDIADPTEYDVAIFVLGSYPHWKRLLENKLIMEHIQEWRDELEIMLRSQALKAMITTARFEGAKGTTAAKYLAEKGWVKRPAGAPSKAEKERQLKIDTAISDEISDDAARLGIH